MSKQNTETINKNPVKIPWIGGLKKPVIDFRLPDITWRYDTFQKYFAFSVILLFVFLLSGGIYNLAENPISMGSTETRLVPVLKTINDQFLVESFIAGVLIFIGAIGVYLIRYSTRFAYDIQNSITLLIIGGIIVLVAVAGITIMYNYKAGIG